MAAKNTGPYLRKFNELKTCMYMFIFKMYMYVYGGYTYT